MGIVSLAFTVAIANDQSGRNWLCIIGGCCCLCALPGDMLENVASACHWMKQPESAQSPEARGQAVLFHISLCALAIDAGGAGMKRINALTMPVLIRVVVRGFRPILKPSRTWRLWLLSYYCTGGAKYPWRQSVYRIEPDFVAAQLDSVFTMCESTPLKSVCWRKPILLKGGRTVATLSDPKRGTRHRYAAKSGDPLLSPSAVATLRSRYCHRFH